MEEQDYETLIVVFTIILEILLVNDKDSRDPYTNMKAPKIPPKAEIFFWLIICQLFITQIAHICKAVVSNFNLYLQW